MSNMKRIIAFVMVLVMAIFAVGCSTPSVAISVDGHDYSTGEYLAYLYNNATMLYYYYSNYGDVSTMWSQTLPYSNPYTLDEEEEESKKEDTDTSKEEEEKYEIAKYLELETKDQILYLAAIESLMKEYGFSISDEDKKEAEDALKSYSESDLITKGFSFENFKKMYLATNYDENTLFDGLYAKGGKKEVAEKEVRKFFDDNYLAYEIIQITTVDSDGNTLAEDEVNKIQERLEKYLEVYESTGDFDKAIAAYDKDNSSEEDAKEEETEEDTDSEGGRNYDGTITNVTSNNSENVRTLDASSATDEDLVKAVRSVDEGDVKIVEYDQDGTSHMKALIYRIDPDGKGRETYYEDSKSSVLKSIKGDEFKKLIIDRMDKQSSKVVVSDRALGMAKPEEFFK